MAYLNIEVWDTSGSKKNLVEVPDDVPINRIIAILIDRLNMPRHTPDGQLLSYKFHHQASKRQLLDDQSLAAAGVQEGDVLRLQPEITAGAGAARDQPVAISARELDDDDRFARFRLIKWWDQAKLAAARVLVIGAGALGNEILKNLALLGVGQIFVADLDLIEGSNLSRAVLFREGDKGAGKAEVAARALRDLYPEVKVQGFQGDVGSDLGLGVFAWADVVIAGLDNREARLAVNRACWKTGTPWIDGATEYLAGLMRVFVPPHGACYECTMGKTDWEIIKERRACNFLSRDDILLGRAPTTPTTASVIAALQCQEALKLLHGLEVLESQGFIFNGMTHDSYLVSYPRKADCLSHETLGEVRDLGLSVRDTRVGDLLGAVQQELGQGAVIELHNEVVEALACNRCQLEKRVLTSLGKLTVKDGKCPSCGGDRFVKALHSLTGREDFLDRTFADLGVPPYDIITGRNGLDQIFLKFDGDAPQVLGPLHQS